MGRFLCAVAICAAALTLSACNIEISLLGHGQVAADGVVISSCNHGNQCITAGYNQLVALTAEAGPGYEFAGWTGACSGTGSCVIRSISDQQVAAIFKTRDAFVPLMNYSAANFLSGPWPSDLKTKADGSLNLNGFPFDSGVFYAGIKSMGSKRMGFARTGGVFFPMATFSDTVYEGVIVGFSDGADQQLQLVNIEPSSAHYLQRIPVGARMHRDDQLTRDSLLQVLPADGYQLAAGSRYAAILFTENTPYLNLELPVIRSEAMQRIATTGGAGMLGQHWETVRNYVTGQTPYDPQQVAAFTVFRTQSESSQTALVSDYLKQQSFQQELQSLRYQGLLSQSCSDGDSMSGQSELHEFVVTLPNLIQGKPPFIVGGGQLNLNAQHQLESTGFGIEAKFWLAVPCDSEPPAAGYPTEIFAMGTAITLADFLDAEMIDMENHGALKVYLAAPYTSDRIYEGGLANIDYLEPLLGLTSAELLPALGDFNPLNLNAVEPQYLQYASDMVVTLEVVKRLASYLAGGDLVASGLTAQRVKVDSGNITLAGYSLGALAAIRANTLTDNIRNLILVSMPRVNIEHFNNILEYLDDNFIGQQGMSALQALLGFNYPSRLSDPQLNVMQAVIDPLDPTNLIASLSQTNLLLVMSDFHDPLHGKAPSYNLARAVDLQLGIQPMIQDMGNSGYPFDDYLNTPPEFFGIELEGSPMRVLAYEYEAGALIDSFTRQMKAGRLPTSVGPYGW